MAKILGHTVPNSKTARRPRSVGLAPYLGRKNPHLFNLMLSLQQPPDSEQWRPGPNFSHMTSVPLEKLTNPSTDQPPFHNTPTNPLHALSRGSSTGKGGGRDRSSDRAREDWWGRGGAQAGALADPQLGQALAETCQELFAFLDLLQN